MFKIGCGVFKVPIRVAWVSFKQIGPVVLPTLYVCSTIRYYGSERGIVLFHIDLVLAYAIKIIQRSPSLTPSYISNGLSWGLINVCSVCSTILPRKSEIFLHFLKKKVAAGVFRSSGTYTPRCHGRERRPRPTYHSTALKASIENDEKYLARKPYKQLPHVSWSMLMLRQYVEKDIVGLCFVLWFGKKAVTETHYFVVSYVNRHCCRFSWSVRCLNENAQCRLARSGLYDAVHDT